MERGRGPRRNLTQAADEFRGATGGLSPEELAERARAGSSACFASLVGLYHSRVFWFLRRRSACDADAEDLTQDTFVRAWEKIELYKPGMKFGAWLFTIAARLHATDRRRAARKLPRPDSGGHRSSVERMGESEEARRVWELAGRVLSESQWAALWLRHAEGLEYGEIGRVLGKTGLSARVLVFRAKDRLARELAAVGSPAIAQEADGSRRAQVGRAIDSGNGGTPCLARQ